jgi:hypothetical protein
MDEFWWWIMDVIGPVILLILLAWLAFRAWGRGSRAENDRAERGTRDVYREEETRRREGTDDL